MNLTTPTKPARTTSAQLRNTFGDLLTGPGLKDVLASSRRYAMTMADSATTVPAHSASAPTSVPTWATDSRAYTCPELQRNPGVPAARFAAYALPSRVGNRLHYPDGRVVNITEAQKP